MRKIKFCGLLIGFLYLMSSCLGGSDGDDINDWMLGNAQIASFSLSNDSVPGLSSVRFTIDQINGQIYNKDSMPYGTRLDQKLLCNIDWEVGAISVLFLPQATGDSVWWTVNDSIDFSAPVKIIINSFDGISTKNYEARLNVHQVNPDTMVWHKYTDLISGKTFSDMKVLPYGDSYYMYVEENDVCRLYITDMSDMVDWREVSLSGFPEGAVLSQITNFEGDLFVISENGELYHSGAGQNLPEGQTWSRFGDFSLKTLLGYLPDNNITGRFAVLSGIIDDNGSLRFVSIGKDQSVKTGAEVPETFPLSGFGSINYESMYNPRLAIASGRDSRNNLSDKVWSTLDALSWASFSNVSFTPREGTALSYYDDCLFIVGGINASGTALNDILYSKDHGMTWIADSAYVMSEEYTPRGFASVVIDKNNYMLLFGGKAGKDNNILNELWRGRINRLGFGKD